MLNPISMLLVINYTIYDIACFLHRYLLNYSPWDLMFKMSMSPIFLIPASVVHEGLRLRFVYLGLIGAAKVYPKAPIVILLGGIIKGRKFN